MDWKHSDSHQVNSNRREFLQLAAAAIIASQLRSPAHCAEMPTIPPELDAAEQRFQEFVMQRLMDSDGLCRSFVHAETLAPWTAEQLKTLRESDLNDWFQNAPDKSACLAYENAIMATSEFAISQLARQQTTGSQQANNISHLCIQGVLAVIREGRHYMPGYLPKPFGGVVRARDSHELSVDQYTKAIAALQAWKPRASPAELEAINGFFVDAADFFIARRFRHAYRHRTIVTAGSHHHALGLFVPLLYVAAEASGDKQYLTYLDQFRQPIEAALTDPVLANFNMTSLLIEGMNTAIAAGAEDPQLPKLIAASWTRATANVDEAGNAFNNGRSPASGQGARIAGVATLVQQFHPELKPIPTALKILGRLTQVSDMAHQRVEGSISSTAVTSWLLGYWRIRALQSGTSRN